MRHVLLACQPLHPPGRRRNPARLPTPAGARHFYAERIVRSIPMYVRMDSFVTPRFLALIHVESVDESGGPSIHSVVEPFKGGMCSSASASCTPDGGTAPQRSLVRCPIALSLSAPSRPPPRGSRHFPCTPPTQLSCHRFPQRPCHARIPRNGMPWLAAWYGKSTRVGRHPGSGLHTVTTLRPSSCVPRVCDALIGKPEQDHRCFRPRLPAFRRRSQTPRSLKPPAD